MATGGIFQLITNDGKQDRMLMASALLKSRIEAAMKQRRDRGDSDDTPTLYDIERTHILFTNAHFKPFAAIGFEYNKVTNSAGSAQLGSKVIFSIPQFGDFFNDMVVHAVLSQPSMDTSSVTDPSDENLFRWCHYPGERLLKNVKFEVNGNPLDEYTSDATNFHREFSVQPNKELGWDRCVGQEEYLDGYDDQPTWVGSGVAASAVTHRMRAQATNGHQTPTGAKSDKLELFIPLLFWCNKDPRLAVPSVAIPYGQRFITLELADAVDLVGRVPRGANVEWTSTRLDNGGTLSAPTLDTIELYINNIFVNPEVHNIFIKRIGFTLIRVHRAQVQLTTQTTESVLMQNLKWPIEALFIGVRVERYHNASDAAVKAQHLDKWHKFSTVTDTAVGGQGACAKRATVESGATVESVSDGLTGTITVNAAVGDNTSATLVSGTGNWSDSVASGAPVAGDVVSWTNGTGTFTGTVASVATVTLTLVESQDEIASQADTPADVDGDLIQVGGADAATAYSLTKCSAASSTSTVQVCTPTVTALTVRAHGIPIYNNFPQRFYNAYTPYTYGGHNVRTPKDCGAMMVTFCLYPGSYQPSGHINISRAREFYLEFTNDASITANNPGTLVVIASAINFLLISDGSAVLRYST